MSEEIKEKSAAAQLKEKLFLSKKSGCLKVTAEETEAADSFCEEYKNFLNNGKIEREAVAYRRAFSRRRAYLKAGGTAAFLSAQHFLRAGGGRRPARNGTACAGR